MCTTPGMASGQQIQVRGPSESVPEPLYMHLRRSNGVRRHGLEPRTRGLRAAWKPYPSYRRDPSRAEMCCSTMGFMVGPDGRS
jgi:hypothetical protein